MNLETQDILSSDILSERFKVLGDPTEDEMIAMFESMSSEWPDHRFLFTLDDYYQACYTSCHSKMKHDLDSIEGHDLSGLPDSCFEETDEGREHFGYFQHPDEFPMRFKNFMSLLPKINPSECVPIFGSSEEDSDYNGVESDLTIIVDEPCYLIKVPVKNACETIISFPNGYFSDDLSPFEIYTFSKYMEDTYSYKLFGVGASFIALLKTRDLSESEINSLVKYCGEGNGLLRESVVNKKILSFAYGYV